MGTNNKRHSSPDRSDEECRFAVSDDRSRRFALRLRRSLFVGLWWCFFLLWLLSVGRSVVGRTTAGGLRTAAGRCHDGTATGVHRRGGRRRALHRSTATRLTGDRTAANRPTTNRAIIHRTAASRTATPPGPVVEEEGLSFRIARKHKSQSQHQRSKSFHHRDLTHPGGETDPSSANSFRPTDYPRLYRLSKMAKLRILR